MASRQLEKPVILAPILLAAGIALGGSGGAPPHQVTRSPVPISVLRAVAAQEAVITPDAGSHPRCATGSFAGRASWGLYLHMSECITSSVDGIGTQVAAIAGLFVYLGVLIPGGVVLLSYVGLFAAAVGALEGLIWLVDRFECGNRGVTIFYGWAAGFNVGC
jgi:hypothetical protein